MAKCSSCSAPLPARSIICSYCDTRNDVDFPEPAKKAFISFSSERICPNCRVRLHSVDVGKNAIFLIEKCLECHGLFFDNTELDQLLESTIKKSYLVDHRKIHALIQIPRHQDSVFYRRCPVCNELMERENYKKYSGVIMDVCVNDGIWLDGGEFKQIEEWIRLGGHHRNGARTDIDARAVRINLKEAQRERLNHKASGSQQKEETKPRALGLDPYFNLLSDFFEL